MERFGAKAGCEIAPAGLKNLLDKKPNNVCVVDVRGAERYDAGHIPGARSVPIDALASSFYSLTKDMMIVTYCGDIDSGLSLMAVLELARRGFPAHRLIGGFAQWCREGFPIEMAPSPAPSRETR
jgi:rhodanese-related sulfurtransferase